MLESSTVFSKLARNYNAVDLKWFYVSVTPEDTLQTNITSEESINISEEKEKLRKYINVEKAGNYRVWPLQCLGYFMRIE